MIEVTTDYSCPSENFFGVAVVNMTVKFEGCPSYFASWLKSCGKDAIRNLLSITL